MGGKAKILFVDDDPEILATLKRTFRRQYLVETAVGPLRCLAGKSAINCTAPVWISALAYA